MQSDGELYVTYVTSLDGEQAHVSLHRGTWNLDGEPHVTYVTS